MPQSKKVAMKYLTITILSYKYLSEVFVLIKTVSFLLF